MSRTKPVVLKVRYKTPAELDPTEAEPPDKKKKTTNGPSTSSMSASGSSEFACHVCRKVNINSRNKITQCCTCLGFYHKKCVTPSVRGDVDDPRRRCNSCGLLYPVENGASSEEGVAAKQMNGVKSSSNSPALAFESGTPSTSTSAASESSDNACSNSRALAFESGTPSSSTSALKRYVIECYVCKTDIIPKSEMAKCTTCLEPYHRFCCSPPIKDFDNPRWECNICCSVFLGVYLTTSTEYSSSEEAAKNMITADNYSLPALPFETGTSGRHNEAMDSSIACAVCMKTNINPNNVVECFTCMFPCHQDCAFQMRGNLDVTPWQCYRCCIFYAGCSTLEEEVAEIMKTDDDKSSSALTSESATSDRDSVAPNIEIVQKNVCYVCQNTEVSPENMIGKCCMCKTLYHKECVPLLVEENIDSALWKCDVCCLLYSDVFKAMLNFNCFVNPEAPVIAEVPANPEAPVSEEAPANPEAPVSAEALANKEAPVSAEALANSEAPVSAEALANKEAPVSAEALANSEAPVSAEAPANKETLANKEAPVSAEALANPEAPISAEALANKEAPISAEALAKPKTPVSAEAIANPKALVNVDASVIPEASANPKAAVNSDSIGRPKLIRSPARRHPRSVLKPRYDY